MLILLTLFLVAQSVVPYLSRRLGRRVFPVLAIVPAAAFVHTLVLTPLVLAGGDSAESVSWLPALGIEFSVRLDTLSWLLALVVTGVGALVLSYCAKYFSQSEEGLGRFAAVLLAFTGTMYGLVIADNVYLLFILWEATSVFSYLLIGHYTGRRASRRAALQALIVTTSGGLVMLVGLVMLSVNEGSTSISGLVALAQDGQIALDSPLVVVAVMLILVGALSKSAIIPFQSWLPAAMVAPTPVSAYLHAAAMVQAGIYLIARLAPGFAATPGWRIVLLSLGVLTMIYGAAKALRQFDVKLILAYGTVSQLGFLTVMVGFGTRTAALAGLALLLAHALFKAALFLVVGIIDRRAGTRDLRKLSGLGREAPFLTAIATAAALSMIGAPLTLGFVAKEAVWESLLEVTGSSRASDLTGVLSLGDGLVPWIVLVGLGVASALTVTYTARFLWGAFARKPNVEVVRPVHESVSLLLSPGILAFAGIVLAPFAGSLNPVLTGYSQQFSASADHDYELLLWHGFDAPLLVSTLTIVAGLALFFRRRPVQELQRSTTPASTSQGMYGKTMRGLDRVAARVTSTTQRGSLPFYLGIILLVLIGTVGSTLLLNKTWPAEWLLFDSLPQLAIGVIISIAAVALTLATKRFHAALLVGAAGYGMATLFAFHGAPDLALTQALVETMTLIAFVLLLRRLPARLGQANTVVHRTLRAVLGVAVGVLMSVVAIVSLGARTALPVSVDLPAIAFAGGHGTNTVNVILVDVRSWDTLGELAVIIAAATGVASLVFLRTRTDRLPRANQRSLRRGVRARMTPIPETLADERVPGVGASTTRNAWLLAGRKLAPENRSILLEVTVRLLFHSIIVLSVFVLFAGHNNPGGGFAAGLVAGFALAARYLAGGRYELGAATPLDAGKLFGLGLALAVGTAVVPMLFGANALTSYFFEATVPVLGHLEFTTSTLFDIGVYLVVIGMVLDVLRSLGAEVDRQQEESSDELAEGSTI